MYEQLETYMLPKFTTDHCSLESGSCQKLLLKYYKKQMNSGFFFQLKVAEVHLLFVYRLVRCKRLTRRARLGDFTLLKNLYFSRWTYALLLFPQKQPIPLISFIELLRNAEIWKMYRHSCFSASKCVLYTVSSSFLRVESTNLNSLFRSVHERRK